MVVATGVDLAEIERIARALAAPHGARFRERVFTEEERRYCESRGRGSADSYAARFAAKEAVMKALGVGWGRDAGWRDIAVVRERGGPPRVELAGSARETARRKGIARLSLALSHAGGLAIAFVVAEDGAH
ncbi:MAG TPA: holo-ACP synthase [Candidatus Binatia bacterium]|nr:holo-ACP synthase [Candidatus Binatia bacterium]